MDKLYYLPVDETINQDTFNLLLPFVSKEKQEQVNRFHFDIDKKLSLYADLLVRINAYKMVGIKNKDIVFEKGEHGKPYIKGYLNFHYNISHTRNALVIAISDKTIGVDIEKIRKAELKIAHRFFTVYEQEYINEFTSKADKRFYEIWTKKEAYIKYISKGLSMPINSFNTLDVTISQKIQTFEKENYIISVCNRNLNEKCDIIELVEKQVDSMTLELLN